MSRIFHLLTLVLLCLPYSSAQQAADVSVSWSPDTIFNGSPILFTVRANGITSISGRWQEHPLNFFRAKEKPNLWYALAGVDVGSRPGDYDLILETRSDGNLSRALHRMVAIGSAPYKEIPLTVAEKFVEPDAKEQKIIAADQEIKNRIFSNSAPTPLWIGRRFSPPLHSAPRTDSFGTRRIFNGSLASIHRGLDYRAKIGTPVLAVNDGRVVLARPLYYEGYCVIIDHGLGLMTLYMHLSKFKVKEGQIVKRGERIALSGGTGRATGPHLHLGVRWQGEYLDPAKLFLLDLPSPEK